MNNKYVSKLNNYVSHTATFAKGTRRFGGRLMSFVNEKIRICLLANSNTHDRIYCKNTVFSRRTCTNVYKIIATTQAGRLTRVAAPPISNTVSMTEAEIKALEVSIAQEWSVKNCRQPETDREPRIIAEMNRALWRISDEGKMDIVEIGSGITPLSVEYYIEPNQECAKKLKSNPSIKERNVFTGILCSRTVLALTKKREQELRTVEQLLRGRLKLVERLEKQMEKRRVRLQNPVAAVMRNVLDVMLTNGSAEMSVKALRRGGIKILIVFHTYQPFEDVYKKFIVEELKSMIEKGKYLLPDIRGDSTGFCAVDLSRKNRKKFVNNIIMRVSSAAKKRRFVTIYKDKINKQIKLMDEDIRFLAEIYCNVIRYFYQNREGYRDIIDVSLTKDCELWDGKAYYYGTLIPVFAAKMGLTFKIDNIEGPPSYVVIDFDLTDPSE